MIGIFRHWIFQFLGLGQEVHHIGRQPFLAVAAGVPHAKRSVRPLHGEDPPDGVLHPAPQNRAVFGDPQRFGDFRHVKQRQRPAGGLLGAAIGISVQRFQQFGKPQFRTRAERDHGLAGAWNELIQEVGGKCLSLARLDARADLFRDACLGGANRDLPVTHQLEPVRTRDGQGQGADAQPHAAQRPFEITPRIGGQLEIHDSAIHAGGAFGLEGDNIFARGPVHVMDRNTDLGLVSGRQEARQCHLADHGVAHRHVGLGRANGGFAPGHRHQAQAAVEVGHLQRHGHKPVVADRDNAGKQRDGLDATGVQPAKMAVRRGLVTALADGHRAALGRGDQMAVTIA